MYASTEMVRKLKLGERISRQHLKKMPQQIILNSVKIKGIE